MGGRFLLKLNIVPKPIVNKYHEGKVKRTLERGLKVPEIVMGEAKVDQCRGWNRETIAANCSKVA